MSVTVEQRVIEIVCEHLAVMKDQVDRNTKFIEDIGADSLDIVELVMEMEEEFDIQIPDDQAEKIKSVGEMTDYVEAALKGTPPPPPPPQSGRGGYYYPDDGGYNNLTGAI